MQHEDCTPLVIQIFWGLLSICMCFFVKNDKFKVVLTSFHGKGYRGNTKVIFEALVNHPKIHPVWLTRNNSLLRDLEKRYGPKYCQKMHSFDGVKHLLSASVVMLTHGTSDFPFLQLPRKAAIIQTYHGLPTKRGEYLRPHSDSKPSWIHRKILEYRFGLITHFISSSPLVTQIFSKRFNIPTEKFIEVGYPAYDSFINANRSKTILSKTWPQIKDQDRIILYAPTYRKKTSTRWFPFDDLNLHDLNSFLDTNNAYLLLRPHPNESVNFTTFLQFNRIIHADQ